MTEVATGCAVVCEKVSKRYGGKRVLDELDLCVPEGSVVGMLGKNGAGKSTLIKGMLGLVRMEGGTMRTLGEEPWELSAGAKERIGYVPQTPAIYPWMKARQVVGYVGSFYARWNRKLAGELMERWEVPGESRVGTLSGGQLQKLAIVLALGHEPELLVLDEPAAALDPAARREFLGTLLEITVESGERPRTILFSTHITADIERVADRVAILKAGKIAYFGPLDALKESVKRLHIAAARPLGEGFTLPGMLGAEVSGNRARVSVKDVTAEGMERIRAEVGGTVEVEDLNLDEIFLELHHA